MWVRWLNIPYFIRFSLQIRNEFSVNINEIIFFDDDVKNCISAQREGYITFNVTGKKGFNFKDIKLMQ